MFKDHSIEVQHLNSELEAARTDVERLFARRHASDRHQAVRAVVTAAGYGTSSAVSSRRARGGCSSAAAMRSPRAASRSPIASLRRLEGHALV